MCVEQENTEREAVERRRRQQRERERLSRVGKRRTIAACSRQSVEHEALESILKSFLSTSSRRRQPSSSRDSLKEILDKNDILSERPHVPLDNTVNMDKKDTTVSLQEQNQNFQITPEISEQKEQNEMSPTEEQDKSCLKAQDSLGKVDTVVSHEKGTEQNPCGVNVQCTPTVPNRTQCIEDKATPKSNKTHRILLKQNSVEMDEQQKKNEETDQAHEDFQKEPCQIRCPVSDFSSPHHIGIKKVDLALQNGFGSPWTVYSPHVSPSCVQRRRHSFSSTNDEESEDGVWALPSTPTKGPLMCRSYEHSMSTSVISLVGIRDSPLKGTSTQGPLLRSASVGENPESISSFRFSALFPRRHGRENKRHELSTLKSFFQRFGEKGRPASVGDTARADL